MPHPSCVQQQQHAWRAPAVIMLVLATLWCVAAYALASHLNMSVTWPMPCGLTGKSMAALAGGVPVAAAGPVAAVSDDMLQCSDAQASQRSNSASSSDQSSTDLRGLRQQRRSQRLSQQTAACTGARATSAVAPGGAILSQCPPLPAAAAATVQATHGPVAAAATQPLPRATRAKLPPSISANSPSASANVEHPPQQAAPKQTRPSHIRIQQARGQKQQTQQVAAVQEAQDDAKLFVDQQPQEHLEQNQARQQWRRQPKQQHNREECAHDLPDPAAVRSPMAPAARSQQQLEQLQGALKQIQTPTAAVQPGSKSTEPPVRPRALRSVTRQLAFVAADNC